MELRTCNKCGIEKELCEFSKDKYAATGYKRKCKLCYKEYDKEYNARNKAKISLRKASDYQNNTEKHKSRSRARNAKRIQWEKNRRNTDVKYKLRRNMSARIRDAVLNKRESTIKYLGCTIESFYNYIENQFHDGMNWDNYGKRGWQLDHVIPLAKYDLSDENQVKDAFHYTNMQPLWWYDNLKKRDKIPKYCMPPSINYRYGRQLTDAEEMIYHDVLDRNHDYIYENA